MLPAMIFTRSAEELVALLRVKGIKDERVLSAVRAVPRDQFVTEGMRSEAWEDCALPIGEGQTISQPYVVALMTAEVRLDARSRMLEVGTGSGYAAAVAAKLCERVDTVERHEGLAAAARERLLALGVHNVTVFVGDGTLGLPDRAPFDAIVVTAGGPRVPEALLWQLAPGGRLLMPVGGRDYQTLVRVTRTDGSFAEERLIDVRFVPLVGAEGW